MLTKFGDMKIGDRFECWGDTELGRYEYPKICLVEKDSEFSVTEILKSGARGESILMEKSWQFEVIVPTNPSKEQTKQEINMNDGIVKVESYDRYEISPDAMKRIIADDLNVAYDCIDVDYVIEEVGGDPLDQYRGVDTVTKIKVRVRR